MISMKTKETSSNSPARVTKVLGILAIFCLCAIALLPSAGASESTSVASASWSGTWNTAGSTPIASQTLGVLTLTQTGSSVTGTFSNNDHGKGTITGTVSGNQLTGTWTVNYGTESDSGSFTFVLSDNKNAFVGQWISASDSAADLSTTEEFWDGVR
jgi:hypothetical protein